MNPRVKEVYPNEDWTLLLIFDNGEKGVFDVTPYLEKGIFSQLKDLRVFRETENAVIPDSGYCRPYNTDGKLGNTYSLTLELWHRTFIDAPSMHRMGNS